MTEDHFDGEGQSIRKALMRTPIDGARLTSSFGNRKHPTLGYTKMHRGVDFGAPTGTPIFAAGDGIINFAGLNGNYGKIIRIRHRGSFKTVYAHLLKFAKGIRKGRRVYQGQVIGYVGTTGLSTGPHLHYEFRINGAPRNSRTVKLPDAKPVPDSEMARFQKFTEQRLAQFNVFRESNQQLALASDN